MDRGRFGRWLDITMDNQGVQGRDIAKRLHVTDGAISRWRNGQSVPNQETLRDLAEILHVDLLRLMATAGIPGLEESGVEPLPVPEPHARREKARGEIKNNKYLDRYERQVMIETYDRLVQTRSEQVV